VQDGPVIVACNYYSNYFVIELWSIGMPWATKSRGDNRLTVLALPADVKAQLIKNKALTRRSVTSQIVEALQRAWGTANQPGQVPIAGSIPGVPMRVGSYQAPPAVVPNPAMAAVGDLVVSGRYKGMISQHIPKGSSPGPQWNL
jgi:hypothetical protein